MKLLFDENLSHHLIEALSDLYPESTHVRNVGLEEADDRTIWSYAIEHDYVTPIERSARWAPAKRPYFWPSHSTQRIESPRSWSARPGLYASGSGDQLMAKIFINLETGLVSLGLPQASTVERRKKGVIGGRRAATRSAKF